MTVKNKLYRKLTFTLFIDIISVFKSKGKSMVMGMTETKKDTKKNILLFLACMLAYIVICFARSNYAATIAYIVKEGIFSKPQSGFISSAFWIFYAVGQLFGGRMVDKFSPYVCIGIGVFATMISNVIIACFMDYNVILIAWSLCGLLQFGVWPGVIRVIATDVYPEFRQRAGFHISYAATLGSIFSYLAAIVLLEVFGWSFMFGGSAVVLFITLIILALASRLAPEKVKEEPKTEKEEKQKATEPRQGMWQIFAKSGFIITVPISLMICMLSTGTQVWIPTMIMESYKVSAAWANVQSIILAVVCTVALLVFMPLLGKIKNEIRAKTLFSLITMVPLAVLPFIGKIPMWFAVMMLILFQVAVNFSSSYSPSMYGRFAPYGYSGTAAGLTSAVASFGDVFSGVGYGLIAEKFGWSGVTLVWLVLIVLIIVGYLIVNIFWKRFFNLKK